jgi:hypothetical protein
MGCSFLVMLAGGSLWAAPAPLLAWSRLVTVLAGRLAVVTAIGGPLGLDALDGRAGALAVGPLDRALRFRPEGPVRICDAVGMPVLFDRGGGLAPGSPAPG